MRLGKLQAKWKWLARDSDGVWWFYPVKPSLGYLATGWCNEGATSCCRCPFIVPFKGFWKDSLHKRCANHQWKLVRRKG